MSSIQTSPQEMETTGGGSTFEGSSATGLPVRVRRDRAGQAAYLQGGETRTANVLRAWDTDIDREEVAAPARENTWGLRGVWLGLVAFGLAGLGQWMLFSEGLRGLGAGLLALGAVAGVAAWKEKKSEVPRANKGKAWWRVAWRYETALRLSGMAGSVVLLVGAVVVYMNRQYEVFGLQGVMWLASMGMLIGSCVRWGAGRRTSDDGRWTTDDGREAKANEKAAARSWEWVVFGGLVVLALVTHLAFLQQIPWRMHFDEGYAYEETMRFYKGPAISLFTTTWQGTSLPSLWFGLQGLLMHITGPTLAGVRLGVALAGALTVIPVYGIGRLLGGRVAAALAGLGVATSAVYIHYSRVSILNITTALAWSVCFHFLLKGLRSRRAADFMWAGLAAGLSMYTYYGTRLLPYLLAAFFVYMLVFHFKASRERLGHFALAGVGFVVGFGPLIGYFIMNPTMWAARGLSSMNVPAVIPTTWDAIVSDWNVLAPLAWQNFLGLSVLEGRDTVYWAAFLLPWEAALVVLGVGLLVWKWREPGALLVLLWGFGVVLAGGTLLSADSVPNFAHWTPAFPAFYLAMALPVALWWEGVKKAPKKWVQRVGAAALVVLALGNAVVNVNYYVAEYPHKVRGDTSLEAVVGRYIESVPPHTLVMVMGATTWGWRPQTPLIGEMMASPGSRLVGYQVVSQLPVSPVEGQSLAFVFFNDAYDQMPAVEAIYPGGTEGELYSLDGSLMAKSYFVPAEKAR